MWWYAVYAAGRGRSRQGLKTESTTRALTSVGCWRMGRLPCSLSSPRCAYSLAVATAGRKHIHRKRPQRWGEPARTGFRESDIRRWPRGVFSTPRGPPLTLGLQLGQDGLCGVDGGRGEGLDPFLGYVAHSPDVGVSLLGGGIGGAHHPTRGTDKRQVGDTVHHAGLWRAGDRVRALVPTGMRSLLGTDELVSTTPGMNNCTKQEAGGSSTGLTT